MGIEFKELNKFKIAVNFSFLNKFRQEKSFRGVKFASYSLTMELQLILPHFLA